MIQAKNNIENLVRVFEKEESRLFKTRMDRNERTHPFSTDFIDYVKSKMNGEILMTYPEPAPLYERFSSWLGINEESLLFHSGSDLCIKTIYETYIGKGDKILLHTPGYAMYQVYAKMFEATVDTLGYDHNLHFDVEQYIEKLDSSYKIVVIENPNGFTGSKNPLEQIKALIDKAFKLNVLVVVDEAYFHFIDETACQWLDEYDNIIITRTFSKAFGLAGLRAGYLISRPENIQYLARVKPMHELNSMAILMINCMLDKEDEFNTFINETKESLSYLKQSFKAMGIDTSNSVANFLAARLGSKMDGSNAKEYLEQYSFLIRRPFREDHLKDWTRIGTAPLEVEKKMIDILQKAISSL